MSRLLFLTLSLLSLATLSAASPQDSGLCQICQVAVGVQQMQLKMATGSLEQADQFIRSLCQSMKNPDKHRCILWLSDMERNTTWFMNTPPHEICKTWMKDECDTTTTTTLLKQRQDDPKCMTCYMMGTVIGVTEKMNISRDNLPSILSSICQLTHTDPCPMDKLDDMINEIDAGTAIDDMCHHENMCQSKPDIAKKKPHDQTMCGICQLIVGSEQMQLKLAEGSLRDADKWVHNLCSSMSDPHQRYDCFQLVKKLENDVTWLMSTDASTVCSALYDGVCDNVKPLIEMKIENDHPECMTCHIMGTVIYATEALNMSRDGLPNIFNTICSITGMSQCPLDKLDDMIQTIDNGASVKDMCIKEGLCGGGNKHGLLPKPQDNALCQMCQVVVNVEQIALKLASGVLQAADDFAKSACHMLQNPQQQQCLDFIANVERNTTWFMINTPQVICRTWFSNICANTPALEIATRPPPRPVPVSCVACEIMGSLITVTETFKLPRDNLQSTFSTICALTKLSPCPLSKLPSMILAIDLGISVNDMCINEKLCAPSRKGITVTQPAEKNAVVTASTSKAMVPPSIPCQICQLVAIITQFWLKLASGPIQILNEIIVAICNSLQGSTRDACNNWISKVAQDEEWILENSPETVCAVWVPQVCGGGMKPIMAMEKYEDTTCTSCRLMTRLAQILPNMDTQDTYEVMRKLAVIFHIDMQEMMDLIPIMISMRNQGFSEERADALCVHQHMCYGRAFIAPPPKHSSTSCSVCTGLMSTLQAAHRSNHPVQGFMRSLTIEICLHLGGSISTSCLQLLDEISHDETIMKLSPQQICSNFLVQSCDSPIPPQQLLLGSKPQTSMISMDHALLQPQAISCSTCHLFATLMSVISESNPGLMESSADQWIAVLHNVCSEYADHVRCQALSDYVPTMMRWQERGFNTIQMCQYVEACPAWE